MLYSKRAFLCFAYSLIFFLFFLAPIDTDLGWHLRYGNYLLETGKVLRENTLTHFLANYHWSHSYTFYQLMTALIYKAGGLLGLSIAFATIMSSIFALFNRLNSQTLRANLIAFLTASWLGWGVLSLGWRAQIFTLLGILALVQLFKISEIRPQALLLIPPLFFLWANFHGGFVLGLALIGFLVLDKAFNQSLWQALHLGFAAFASALVALINPFGLGVYQEAIRHIGYPLQNLIAEWVPPPFFVKFLVGGATTLLLGCLLVKRPKKWLFWTLTILFFAWLAVDARRNLPLFGAIALLTAIGLFKEILARLENYPPTQKLASLALGIGIIVLILFRVPKTIEVLAGWQSYCKNARVRLPCQAVEFVKNNPINGKNVYGAYEWGGFLEWQLPEYKFFVDGRMPAWQTADDKSPYTTYLEIIQARSNYQAQLDKFDTDWMLIQTGTFLDLELQKGENPNWQQVYRDEVAAIYIRPQPISNSN